MIIRFFGVDRELALIGILALWSCHRGRGPRLSSFKGLRDAVGKNKKR